MGKGPSKQKSKPLQLTVPANLFEYLSYLARNSFLGTRETEVASHILTEAVRQMIKDEFHHLPFPKEPSDEDASGDGELS